MRSRPLVAALMVAVTGLAALIPVSAAHAASKEREQAQVAVVLPLSLPISTGTFATSDALAAATAESGTLTRELDAVEDTEVTLAIDPMLIASIRVLGSSAPPTATAWLARLSEVSNPTFALAYADADLTAPLQAGASRVLQPGNLLFDIDPSRFSAPSTPEPESTSGPATTDAPRLPTTAELLEWHYTETGVAWPRVDTVTGKELATFATSGLSTTLLGSKNLARTDEDSAAAKIGGRTVVAADEVVSGLLDRALDAFGDDEWDAASAALGSSVAAYHDGSTAVLTFDRSAPINPLRLDDVVNLLEGVGHTELVPLADIAASASSSATLVGHPQSASRVATVRSLLATETRDARFATVAADPTLVTGERRARLLVTLSPGADAASGGFAEAANTYRDESDTLRASVRVEQSSTITLLADRASIYVSVTNDLDQPATVSVSLRALAPLLSIEKNNVEVTVKAHSQGKASIPVQYISNGTVTLLVSLHSPTGVRVGEPLSVTTNVRAGWEGPVAFGLAGTVVLVFAFGLWRALARRRRTRRAEGGAD